MSLRYGEIDKYSAFSTVPFNSTVSSTLGYIYTYANRGMYCEICGVLAFEAATDTRDRSIRAWWAWDPRSNGSDASRTRLLGYCCAECEKELDREHEILDEMFGLTDETVDNEIVWNAVRGRHVG